jgi:hypothetical protein
MRAAEIQPFQTRTDYVVFKPSQVRPKSTAARPRCASRPLFDAAPANRHARRCRQSLPSPSNGIVVFRSLYRG